MKVIKNPEVFKVAGDKEVSVTVVFGAGENINERALLLNAAEALKFYADNKISKSWMKRIEIKR